MPPYDVYDSLPKILARFVITCRYICSVTSSIYFVTSCSYYKCQYRVYPLRARSNADYRKSVDNSD
ncbi:hypothetical protein ALQ03_200085 [Pseudomonas savastanoi pv. glycinea]|uniref:Uncharacterized protein n=1 Tax=Pseudomonas savastanoi pv. glycinea TaxID=318 RepID=A0AB74B693_PSESG|nr:hypothetical protein ALQ14_200088 [Pseudomonas savastanoi pv. glycinea]RMQ19437.1 hypothetical protein ALQ11_200031 [Pseudomonas savastanoi pv. glycinea]RMQ59952.1 hypothetical protein ALQ03_200085 [Pseudomonas savastanoi pv. glycinea]